MTLKIVLGVAMREKRSNARKKMLKINMTGNKQNDQNRIADVQPKNPFPTTALYAMYTGDSKTRKPRSAFLLLSTFVVHVKESCEAAMRYLIISRLM